MRLSRRIQIACFALGVFASTTLLAAPDGGASIATPELREWLGYIASDALEGRAVFGTGIGLAAAYIENHLASWGVKPAGDGGSVSADRPRARGEGDESIARSPFGCAASSARSRMARACTFPRNMGGRQHLTVGRVLFAGYGLDVPAVQHDDFSGHDIAGAAVLWLGTRGPKGLESADFRRILAGRARYAIDQLRAAAMLGPEPNQGGQGGQGARGGQGAQGAQGSDNAVDFTTVERLDTLRAPTVTLGPDVLAFIFSAGRGRRTRRSNARPTRRSPCRSSRSTACRSPSTWTPSIRSSARSSRRTSSGSSKGPIPR